MEKDFQNSGSAKAPGKKLGVLGKLSWLKNKYLIAGSFFLVWMLFFDPKDISSEVNRWNKFRELESSEQHLTKKINNTRTELGELKNNAQTIEKYAREKYLMKKDNEDLFIVSAPKSLKQ
jgi:cell division protein DivIC